MLITNVVDFNREKRFEFSNFLYHNRGTIVRMQKLAGAIHEGVNQRYDEMPYSYHTNMVCNLFMQYGSVCFEASSDIESFALSAVFGALFHDTIEDARLTYHDVLGYAKEFMPPSLVGIDNSVLAADIVYALTNEKGKNRAERENERYFEGVIDTPYAPCIKMCDRYANVLYANARDTSMARKYSKEMQEFLDRLTLSDDESLLSLKASMYVPKELYTLLQTYPIIVNDDMQIIKDKELTNIVY